MSKGKKYSSFLKEQKIFDNWRGYLNENREVIKEGALGRVNPERQALQRQLMDVEATSPERAIRANELFNHENGTLWAALETGGVSPRMMEYLRENFMQKYRIGDEGPLPDGKWVMAGEPNRETIYADFS
jgi:hypothetical protein